MKKLFLFLSFVFVIPAFAQNYKVQIEKQFIEYNTLIKEKQFEKALDLYANETFLKIIPKTQMVTVMKQMFDSSEIDFILENPNSIVINDEVIEQNGEKFVAINYHQDFEMKFNDPDLAKYTISRSLKNEFGEENVTFDNQTGFFLISTEKTAVANSKDSENWKFTIIEKKQIPILIRFIPEQLLKNSK